VLGIGDTRARNAASGDPYLYGEGLPRCQPCNRVPSRVTHTTYAVRVVLNEAARFELLGATRAKPFTCYRDAPYKIGAHSVNCVTNCGMRFGGAVGECMFRGV